MACATAWLQNAVRARHRNRIIVVVDEAWAILSNLGVARWLQSSWKLSRALGVANMAVLHRLSDLRSVGTEGSEQVGLAEGLLADSETRVVYAQSPGEVARTGELLGLTDTEAELVTQLRRGMALWKVGRRSFLVEHRLASGEQWLIDTDQAMAEATAAGDRRPPVGSRGDPGRPGHLSPACRPWPGRTWARRGARTRRTVATRRRPVPSRAPGARRRIGRAVAGESGPPLRTAPGAAPGALDPAGGPLRRDPGPAGGRLVLGRQGTAAAGRRGPSRSSSSGPPSPARPPASRCRPSWSGRGRWWPPA